MVRAQSKLTSSALPCRNLPIIISSPIHPIRSIKWRPQAVRSLLFLRSDLETLNSTFNIIFSDILAQSGSAAAVATNTANLQVDNYIFQAKFQTTDWSGQLLSLRLDTSSGSVVLTEKWDAAPKLDAMSPASRVILTKGAAGGVSFEWANLTSGTPTSQQTLLNTNNLSVNDGLGSARLNYLRGDTTNEGSSPGAVPCSQLVNREWQRPWRYRQFRPALCRCTQSGLFGCRST